MILVEHADNYTKHRSYDSCTAHGISGADKINKCGKRNQKINLRKKVFPLRKILLRNTLESQPLSTKMNHEEDTCKVKYGRKYGPYYDI